MTPTDAHPAAATGSQRARHAGPADPAYPAGRRPGGTAGPDDEAAPRGGIIESARQFLVSLVAHLRTRLELLSIEFAQEKVRLAGVLALGLSAVVLGLMSLVLLVLLVVAWFWDTTWRVPAITTLLIAAVVATVIVAMVVRRRLATGTRLFQASLRELAHDRQWLDRMH